MKLFLSSIFLLLLAPCNQSKNITKTETPTPAASKNSTVIITYECGACFGRCPIYVVTIDGATKTATFVGKQNTTKIGTFTKSITDDELAGLVKAIEDAKFTTLENEYLGPITDFPFRTTTYTNNGITKKIRDRSGAPQALTALEKTIAAYAESDGWKKMDTATSDH
jgi:Domain of unknown function (DUF6438)